MINFSLDHLSYVGIMAVLILTGSGLPIPEEVPIVIAGTLSSAGTLNPWGAFASCLFGALAGDAVIYAIGYHFGHSLVTQHPRFAHLLHAERQAKIEQMIQRHGLKVLFLSRFMVGIRAPIYLTAGILRMPFKRFVLIDLFCATAVVGLFFGLSFLYGEPLTKFIRRSEIGLTVVVVLGLCVVACYILAQRYRRGRSETLADPAPPSHTIGVRQKTDAQP